MNFPSGVEAAQSGKVVDCCDLGSPWERLYGPKWNTYPAGGVLVWGTEGQIILDVGKEGWIKRLLQPDFINLSSHWVRNVGVKSYKIRMDMQLCDFDLHWETPEAAVETGGRSR